MNYKSYDDLCSDIKNNLSQLYEYDFDLVVGIPRSGMIPAYMIALYLNINCTDLMSFIENKKIKSGENPIKFKKKLAFEVTKQLNSEDDAKKAEEEFERVVQKGEPPQDILEIDIKGDDIIDENLLVKHSLADSKSDAKRLFEQNAVRIDGQKISTGQKVENGILNVGRKLVKLNLKN